MRCCGRGARRRRLCEIARRFAMRRTDSASISARLATRYGEQPIEAPGMETHFLPLNHAN